MTGIEPMAYLAARVLSCGVWIPAGLYKAMHFEETVEEIADHGVPLARLVLPVVLLIEFGGSALVLADFYTWAACLVWIAFLFPASYVYHGKFVTPGGGIDFVQMVMFFKNVSILGGLIALIMLDPSRPAWLLRIAA